MARLTRVLCRLTGSARHEGRRQRAGSAEVPHPESLWRPPLLLGRAGELMAMVPDG